MNLVERDLEGKMGVGRSLAKACHSSNVVALTVRPLWIFSLCSKKEVKLTFHHCISFTDTDKASQQDR